MRRHLILLLGVFIFIRDARATDLIQILKLNEESEHFLDQLNAERLEQLHKIAAYHRVVEINGRVEAFLLD